MKGRFMKKVQEMQNSFQAFVENNRSQEPVGEREEELVRAVEEELPQEEWFHQEGEEVQYRREEYSEQLPEQLYDPQLWSYSDNQLVVILKNGEVAFLERALEHMGREEFTSRLRSFDYTGSQLIPIILGYNSDETVSAMTRLIMPEFFERYSGENGVELMLNGEEHDVMSAEFVKLVLRLNPDDSIFTRDSSEIPMGLFIRASVVGKGEVVDTLLSKSEAFHDVFNSQQAKNIFVEYFIETTAPAYEALDRRQEIGFLLDRNPALAELQEVQQAFVEMSQRGNVNCDNLEFLLQKSPVLAEFYRTETVQQNFMRQLEYNPSYEVVKFLLNQDPKLAENIEMQKAFSSAAINIGPNSYKELKCLLNVHPNFAGQLSQEIELGGDLREYDVRRYEEIKCLLDRHPALVGGFARGIRTVIYDVLHSGGYGIGYERIESLLKSYSGFSMFFDEELWNSVSQVFDSIGSELANQKMDTLLEVCPSAGRFFPKFLERRLKDCFAAENLDYEGIESLLKYDPDLGNKCHAVITRRFSDDIKSENPNYEEIQFLSTKFPFVASSHYYYYSFGSFSQLFDKALRDEKTEFIKFLLKIKPEMVTDELHYNNNGKSIIEKAKNGLLPEDITASVLRAACEIIYDMMRRDGDRYASVANTELYKCLGDLLFDDALSFAGRRDFTNTDLILSYFGQSYKALDIRTKLLKGSATRGDIGTVEHIIDTLPSNDSWALKNMVKEACSIAFAQGQGEFVWYFVSRFPEIVVPQFVSDKGNVFESIVQKPVTHEGVNIVKHLLFVDELRQGMKPGGLNAYVDKLKLLCTTSKASYFFPLPDEVRCKIGEFLLDKHYQPYARVKLRTQSSVPEDTLHIKVAVQYMAKKIMTIVNECLVHPLVDEQLEFRTVQCVKWLEDKMTKNLGKLGVISKPLQIELVHDVWQAMVDQPSHKPRVKKAVEDAIDAVLGHHLLLEFDTPALGLAGDHYEAYEVKDGA